MGNVRRGVLEVIVGNSAALQELTFQKKHLLDKIAAALPDQKIRDVRFRIGVVTVNPQPLAGRLAGSTAWSDGSVNGGRVTSH